MKWNLDFFVNKVLILSVHSWKWKSWNHKNLTYQLATYCCIAGTNAAYVSPLFIPKCSMYNTKLCKALLTEPTAPVGHFVYWKNSSSPGSLPTENRTCRKDLWAGFLFWGLWTKIQPKSQNHEKRLGVFHDFVCSLPCGGKESQNRSTKCTFKVSFFISSKLLCVCKRCSTLESNYADKYGQQLFRVQTFRTFLVLNV